MDIISGYIFENGDTRAAINNNRFYHSCQYMLHASVGRTEYL